MNLRRWTVGTKLWTLTGLLMLDVLVVGLVQARSSASLVQQMRELADILLPAVQNMTLLDSRHDGLRAIVLDGLLAGSEQDWERGKRIKAELAEYSEAMNSHLRALSSLPLRQETRRGVEESRAVVKQYVNSANDILNLITEHKAAESRVEFVQFLKTFKALEVQFATLSDQITSDAKEAKEAASGLAARTSITNTILLAAGLLVGLMASVLVVGSHVRKLKEIVTRLSTEAAQVANGAVQVNSASHNLSQAAVEQASAIEETVAGMEEMAATISRTAENAGKSHTVTQRGEEEAQKGQQVIAHMLAAMEGIEDSNSKLQSFVQLIHEIEDKTQIINDIVFETRLLSFNASIEAARAGVHGKGFSVVAEEVGKLAVLSGKAADEIRKLLESSTSEVAKIVRSTQERVLAGKNAFRDCEQTFSSMGDTLQRIRDSVQQIATATQQQEIGVKQTNKAMVAIDHATLNNSKSSETLATLAVDLERGAGSLMSSIASMRALVSGDEPGSSPVRDPSAQNSSVGGKWDTGPRTQDHGQNVSRSDSRWERV